MGTLDITFDNKQSSDKIIGLSLVLYHDSLFYGYWNQNNELIMASNIEGEYSKSDIKALYESYPDLKIEVCSALKPFVQVPYDYFEPLKADKYFDGVYPKNLLKGRTTIFEKLRSQKIFSVHSSPLVLGSKLSSQTRHLSSNLSDHLFQDRGGVLCYFNGNTMYLVYSNEEGLQFYNQYKSEHPQDFLYFILLCYNNAEINTSEVPVYLSGRITRESNIYKLFDQYLDLQFLNFDKKWLGSDKYDQHFYHDLYLSWICG